MITMRLLAPVPVDFYETLGTETAHPSAYAAFWDRARSVTPRGGVLTVRRLDQRGRSNRYTSISADSLTRPLEAFHLELTAADTPRAFATAGVSAEQVRSIEASVFDHGLMIVSCVLDVSEPDSLPDVPSTLDALQTSGVALCADLTAEVHDTIVAPLVEAFRAIDRGTRVLARPHPASSGLDHGRPLWVTRSLFVPRAHELAAPIVAHWLKDVDLGPDPLERVDRLVERGGDDHVMTWLNYAFITDAPAGDATAFHDELAALQFAQYFYAAFDCLDHRLAHILATAVAVDPDESLESLRSELQECSRRAQFAFMQMDDVAKYLTRAVKAHYVAILRTWEFDTVIAEPVRTKIAACERRIDELMGQRAARASFVTDMILLGIGVTSILSTVLAVTEFGRYMATDPEMAGYDTDQNRLVGWVSAQPVDTLLLFSGVISLGLIGLYLHFRRSQRG